MKELQTQTQQTIDCKYDREEREYCDRGTLGNVYVESFTYDDVYGLNGKEELARLIDSLPALEHVMLIEEICNCWEKYGGPMCNDGGNYHSRIRIYEITPCVYLAVYGDTREVFSVDEYKYMVVWVEDQPMGVVVAKSHDCCHLMKKDEAEELIKAYSEDKDYVVYYTE